MQLKLTALSIFKSNGGVYIKKKFFFATPHFRCRWDWVCLLKIHPFLDSNLLCKFFHFPKEPISPSPLLLWLAITKQHREVIITAIS